MHTATYDIIIVGGGMVGTTLACALAQQTSLSIAVVEAHKQQPIWSTMEYQHRVSALALSSVRFLQSIKVWDDIKQARVSPFTQIAVWDAEVDKTINFSGQDIAAPVLGYIVENNLLQLKLQHKMQQYPQITYLSPVTLTAYHETENAIKLQTDTGDCLTAKLAVAADGVHSWLREQAGIAVKVHDYAQEAIVASVSTALSHQHIARQRFLPTGPLAFLPLAEPHLSSIVWSLPTVEAKRLLALPPPAFCAELTDSFSARLGKVETIGERYSFPLRRQLTEHYVRSRVVLVGDSAHTVHPLAGQGLNIGLQDVATLSLFIQKALTSQRDWSSKAVLRRYERARKAESLPMLLGIDWIKNLYASQVPALVQLRNFGLTMTQQSVWLRNIFTKQAVGLTEPLA